MMQRTLPQFQTETARRALAIGAFTLLTVVSARLVIPLEPVPFSMQPLAVLLAGLILGGKDGAFSQLAYLGLIAIGLPVDARMLGAAALAGPTAGFLLGFVVCALVTGTLAERGQAATWRRWLAGAVGILSLYAVGAPFLALNLHIGLPRAWEMGAAPYLLPDLAKAAIAAAMTEAGRRWIGSR